MTKTFIRVITKKVPHKVHDYDNLLRLSFDDEKEQCIIWYGIKGVSSSKKKLMYKDYHFILMVKKELKDE